MGAGQESIKRVAVEERLVKSVCMIGWNWSRGSPGATGIDQEFIHEKVGLVRVFAGVAKIMDLKIVLHTSIGQISSNWMSSKTEDFAKEHLLNWETKYKKSLLLLLCYKLL